MINKDIEATSAAAFTSLETPVDRVMEVARLITDCKAEGVEVEKVLTFCHGFMVIFKDFKGDAILHDFSHNHEFLDWETMGFPWDCDDVSVHSTDKLCKMLGELKRGGSWEKYDD